MSDTRELLPVLLSEKSRKIKGSIYNRMQVDFAYNSNHIEGSRLTHDQTRYIYETRTIDGTVPVNDVFEAANHFKCFDYILDTVNEPITEDYIKQLHRMLKNGVMEDDTDYAVIGDYKKYPNEVGEIETALPEEVAGLVQSSSAGSTTSLLLTYTTLLSSTQHLKRYTLSMTETVVSED